MAFKLWLIAVAAALGACSKAPPSPPAATAPASPPAQAAHAGSAAIGHADTGIAWHAGDVDGAFAAARSANKPVFLYWGATWCPPCNQVKATLFNRQDFIERSRHFVPVYIDGDSPSAQRLGARFNASGYPTMILFTPDGREITRLPGEVDADQYMRVLAMGMNTARPVKETLAAALAADATKGGNVLTAEDWRMLAYYSWITDDGELLPKERVAPTLARLAQACPAEQRETAVRLGLQALSAAATAKDAKPRNDPAAVLLVRQVTSDPVSTRENFDLITYNAGKIAAAVTLPKSAERAGLVTAWDGALDRLAADASLSTADRLTALGARVDLARLDDGKAPLPAALQQRLRDDVARADRETTDVYARQAVISNAAEVLAEAGMLDESDALLIAELTRSHSPYYFMLGLAANAKKRGDKAAALEWHAKAWTAATGAATRLQWGASYLNALVELAPQDSARIESVGARVIGELDAVPDTFYDRNRRALERIGKRLTAWNKNGSHNDALRRLAAQMGSVCAKLPAGDPARATCGAVLQRGAPPAA
jgi:thioredoxin-like negative regulator of GroEL